MASTKELRGKLTLDISNFRSMLRTAQTVAAQAAVATRRAWSGVMTIPTASAQMAFRSVVGMARGAASQIKGIMGAVGVTGLVAGVIGGAVSLGGSINQAASFETATMQFQSLLGSADAAQGRLKELARFAAETPFELPEILAASKVLQVFTKGTLATGKGLTLIGDIAAGTNQPFKDVAFWVGRMYDALSSGRPAGEAFARLQEMGAISGELRSKLEAMGESGAGMKAIWETFTKGTQQFSGGMKTLSGTFSGLMSTLQDTFGALQRAFGGPIIQALKPIISWAITNLGNLEAKAASMGQAVAGFITGAFQAAREGNLGEFLLGPDLGNKLEEAWGWIKLISSEMRSGRGFSILTEELKRNLAVAGNGLIGVIQTGLNLLGQALVELLGGDFIPGLAQSFIGVAKVFGGALLSAFADPLQYLEAGFKYLGNQLSYYIAIAFSKVGPLLDAITAPVRAMQSLMGVKVDMLPSEGTKNALPQLTEWANIPFSKLLEEQRSEGSTFFGYDTNEGLASGLEDIKAGAGMMSNAAKWLAEDATKAAQNYKPSGYFNPLVLDASSKLSNLYSQTSWGREASLKYLSEVIALQRADQSGYSPKFSSNMPSMAEQVLSAKAARIAMEAAVDAQGIPAKETLASPADWKLTPGSRAAEVQAEQARMQADSEAAKATNEVSSKVSTTNEILQKIASLVGEAAIA